MRLLHQRLDHDGRGASCATSRIRPKREIRDALAGLKCRCGTHMAICARSSARREEGLREAP